MELDLGLKRLSNVTRLLPAVTAVNAAEERRRLAGCLARGVAADPAWRWKPQELGASPWRWLATCRDLALDSPARESYLRRLDELELDLELLAVLGHPARVRPLAARRFGSGRSPVPSDEGPVPLARVAAALLAHVQDTSEPRTLPADAPDSSVPSVARLMRAVAAAAGLEVRVAVEPRLAAAAAAGERIVLLADRRFGWREAVRLAVHEVLGHLVSAANGRAQPLRIVELGMAGSFADQEGLCIFLEEMAGVLCGHRLRTLAARVVVADLMHDGVPFGEAARVLVDEHGFEPFEAVTLAERAYRGGGVARDVSYLGGWLRVRRAVVAGEATVDELRSGRVSLAELPALRVLAAEGRVRPPAYRPSLSRSLRATHCGTSFHGSPPRVAASFTRFEAT
ncbi:MAG: tyrosine/phenylalanine carboxypeptidase domain-containing protein [Myxococcota bacterium]